MNVLSLELSQFVCWPIPSPVLIRLLPFPSKIWQNIQSLCRWEEPLAYNNCFTAELFNCPWSRDFLDHHAELRFIVGWIYFNFVNRLSVKNTTSNWIPVYTMDYWNIQECQQKVWINRWSSYCTVRSHLSC